MVDFAFSLFHFHPSLVLVFVLFPVCLGFLFFVFLQLLLLLSFVCSFVRLVEEFFPGVGVGVGFYRFVCLGHAILFRVELSLRAVLGTDIFSFFL